VRSTRGIAGRAKLLAPVAFLVLCAAAWADPTVQVLYSFTTYSDGGFPNASVLLGPDGQLFGVTSTDGEGDGGVVFDVYPTSSGSWTETSIHTFGLKSGDGISPDGPLVADGAGNLYGATAGGGYGPCPHAQCGIVYELSPNSDGTWKETGLHAFHGFDGQMPIGGLVFDRAVDLWGTTGAGGLINGKASDFGTVFMLDREQGWQLTTIYTFTGESDGGIPQASLAIDADGNVWGTTTVGGVNNHGTVFELTPASGAWTFTTVHEFTGGEDGGTPVYGQLVFDRSGNAYGTTYDGGDSNCHCGVVFAIQKSGGTWHETGIHSFTGSDGRYPYGGLTFDRSGNLYGTTSGKNGDYGTIFRLQNSAGIWQLDTIYSFDFVHGAYPYAGLVFGNDGTIYGTTNGGGVLGAGTVYEVVP